MQTLSSYCCEPEPAGPWGTSPFAEFCFRRLISAFSRDTAYFLVRSPLILSRKIPFLLNYRSSEYLSPTPFCFHSTFSCSPISFWNNVYHHSVCPIISFLFFLWVLGEFLNLVPSFPDCHFCGGRERDFHSAARPDWPTQANGVHLVSLKMRGVDQASSMAPLS